MDSQNQVVVALQLGCCDDVAIVRLKAVPVAGAAVNVPIGSNVLDVHRNARQLVGTTRNVVKANGVVYATSDNHVTPDSGLMHHTVPAYIVK